jgi:hypothetical protein
MERRSDPPVTPVPLLEQEPVRWLLVAVLAGSVIGYPLVAGIPIILQLESRVISVPFRVSLLIASIFCVAQSFSRRRFYRGTVWVPLAVFWVLYTGRIVLDTVLDPVPLGTPPSDYALFAIGICLVPMLAAFQRPSELTLRTTIHWMTLLGTVAILLNLYAALTTLLSGNLAGIITGRFELETLNPISMGHLGTTVAGLAIFQLLRSSTRRERALLLGALAIALVAVGVAASKGPLLALAINLVLLLVLDWRAGSYLRVLTIAAAAPILALAGARFLESQGFSIITRTQGAFDDPIRFNLIGGAIDQYLNAPWFGSSLDERVSLTYPHNSIIESFMATGIVGGLCFCLVFAAGVFQSLRLVILRDEVAWVGLIALQYAIGSLFSGSLYTANTMWVFLAAAMTLHSTLTSADRTSWMSQAVA